MNCRLQETGKLTMGQLENKRVRHVQGQDRPPQKYKTVFKTGENSFQMYNMYLMRQ